MEKAEYKELLLHRLSREYEIVGSWQGNEYDLVARKTSEESLSLGNNSVEKTIIAVSGLDEDCITQFVENEIEEIPQMLLSGFRDISKNKSTEFIRVFVMKNIPFDLIQKTRVYDFSRTEQRNFEYVAHAGVLLVDVQGGMIYCNSAAAEFSHLFKIITPVETIEEEEDEV
ncbi:MAG: hypothetical protein KBS64_07170 [Treponema sp.]|nr:hypothetical protein [Candidatus Treponema equi]